MDKAKGAIRDFMSGSGHHDTTVHKTTAPAVQHETVKPTQHEEVNTAVDKEIHQDHYHRTVQPVQDREIQPEQHHHNLGAVQHREVDHRNQERTSQKLSQEAAQFHDEKTVHDTTHTKSHAPTVQGEHVHHHIHETVQPVIHKETVQPHVVHTTVPIHETHHNDAQHHSTTALPPISMSDFKKSGQHSGRTETFDAFDGVPEDKGGVVPAAQHAVNPLDKPAKGTFHGDFDSPEGSGKHHSVTGSGLNSSSSRGMTGDQTARTAATAAVAGAGTTGSHNTATSKHGRHDSGKDLGYDEGLSQKPSTDSRTHKPSLMDRLNPKVDADGDGKAGFLK